MAEKTTPPNPNPSAPEIYGDRATSVALRGNVARITLASDRSLSDTDAPEATVSGHVAMSVRGFLHLYAQMQSVVRQMETTGLIKRPEDAPQAEPEEPKKAAKSTKKPTRRRTSTRKKS